MKIVATRFFTYILNNFSEKNQNSKNTTKISKNVFLIYLFLAFLILSQKNFNFQKYFKRV
jgi:hypothetical protein